MGKALHGIDPAVRRKPRPSKTTVNRARSPGQSTAASARPGSMARQRGGPEEVWIRNTCRFLLGLRKLFISFFPDCLIWQILGEMASSFPRVLEAACLFLQLAVLQVGVMGIHTEGDLMSLAGTLLQGSGRVGWAAEGLARGGTITRDHCSLPQSCLLCRPEITKKPSDQTQRELTHPPWSRGGLLCHSWSRGVNN